MNDKQDRLEKLRELDQRLQDYLSRADSSNGSTEEQFELFKEGIGLYQDWNDGAMTYIGTVRDLALLSPEMHSHLHAVASTEKPDPAALIGEEAWKQYSTKEEKLRALAQMVQRDLRALPSFTSAVDGYMETVSALSPTVIRDSHVLSLMREYLEANYRDVTDFLAKEPHRDWVIGAPEEEDVTNKNLTPLRFFLYKSFDDWERDYGPSVPDVAAVSAPGVYRSVEDTLQEWATAYGFSLEDRGPAIYPSELAPYLSTSKAAHNFHLLDEEGLTFKGGRAPALAGRDMYVTVRAPGSNKPVRLTQTHALVSDAIGSLYHSHHEATGELHARFTLSQITQQVMGNPKPTQGQEKEVRTCIEDLRNHKLYASGQYLDGKTVREDRFLLSATRTSVTNRMGNSVDGYKITDSPALFELSLGQGQARQMDALLKPRPDGEWWPSSLQERTVYHAVCRAIFVLGSNTDKDGYSKILDEDLQRGLGGEWAPGTISAKRERTLRSYRDNAVRELQARGFIIAHDDYKPSRKVIGARVKFQDKDKRQRTDISPGDRRRLERT